MPTGSSRPCSNNNGGEGAEASNKSYQKCLDKAFLLITIRIQTEYELWEKLGKKNEKSDIYRVILRLKELGYVDDKKFASLWVESRSRSRGPGLLRSELIKKGIKRDIIDESLESLDKEAQITATKEAIRIKDKSVLTGSERFKKLGGLLARRGFSYDVIKKALEKD
jgi:regulatory protein